MSDAAKRAMVRRLIAERNRVMSDAPDLPRKTLNDRVQELFDFEDLKYRGDILPGGINKDGEFVFATPKFAMDAIKSMMLPGHVAKGGDFSTGDVADAAMSMMGGGLLASSGTKLDGAVLGMNRADKVGKTVADLFKGRTDEEFDRIVKLSEIDAYLQGKDPRTSGPKTGPGWFPGANVKMDNTVEELNAGLGVTSRGSYDAPVKDIDWGDLQGSTIIPFVGDRTNVGTLTHVLGNKLSDQVKLYGGKDFMRGADDGVWASERGNMVPLSKAAKKYENPIGVYAPMAAKGSDFAHMTNDVLKQLWSPALLTKKGVELVDDIIKTGKGIDGDGTYKNAKKELINVPSVASKEFSALIESHSGLRKAYIQALDRKAVKDEGGPDMGAIRHAITDPELRMVPNPDSLAMNDQLMGWGVSRIDPDGTLVDGSHPTYNTDIKGDYLGRAALIPRSVLMRDFNRLRRSKNADLFRDARSIFTGPTQWAQPIDQELVDAIQGYNLLTQRHAKD